MTIVPQNSYLVFEKLNIYLQMRNSLFHKRFYWIALVIVLTTSSLATTGCRILKRDKQSVAEKKQAEADKKATAEYEKARKAHYNNQSKEAKKSMKHTEKQAAKYNKPRKRSWLSSKKCD
jgi:hypothetical protein